MPVHGTLLQQRPKRTECCMITCITLFMQHFFEKKRPLVFRIMLAFLENTKSCFRQYTRGLTLPQDSGRRRGSNAPAPEGRATGRGEPALWSCPPLKKVSAPPGKRRVFPFGKAQAHFQRGLDSSVLPPLKMDAATPPNEKTRRFPIPGNPRRCNSWPRCCPRRTRPAWN